MARKAGKSKKVRLALIGAGGMANLMHYPSLAEMKNVELAGICDLVPEKAGETAARFKIRNVFTDYRAMLDKTKPDGVYALMPPHHVFDVAIEVMNRKHHLFIEKPPGLNAFQNQQMAQCAARNKVIAMCGFQRRYVPMLTDACARVEKRSRLHTVIVTFVKSSYETASYYNGAIDVLSCDAVHAVDTLRHFCGGEALGVASDVRNLGSDGNNAFYAIVKFSTGATGVLQANWACGRRFFKVEMHGQGVSAYCDPDDHGMIYEDGDEKGTRIDPAPRARNESPHHRLGFFEESAHFIDCILNEKQPRSSLTDTVKTMELVDRIYHSQIRAEYSAADRR